MTNIKIGSAARQILNIEHYTAEKNIKGVSQCESQRPLAIYCTGKNMEINFSGVMAWCLVC